MEQTTKLRAKAFDIGKQSWIIETEQGKHVTDYVTEVNARRLAHCWNCHDDLLAACEAALERIDGMNEAMGVIDELRAAIARAKAGAA